MEPHEQMADDNGICPLRPEELRKQQRRRSGRSVGQGNRRTRYNPGFGASGVR